MEMRGLLQAIIVVMALLLLEVELTSYMMLWFDLPQDSEVGGWSHHSGFRITSSSGRGRGGWGKWNHLLILSGFDPVNDLYRQLIDGEQ